MNKFNQCKIYTLKLGCFVVPKGALYGRDSKGVWVCTTRTYAGDGYICAELYRCDGDAINMYKNDNWYLSREIGATAEYIHNCACKFNIWDNFYVEYPKYTGLHTITNSMRMKSKSYSGIESPVKSYTGVDFITHGGKKCHSIKRASAHAQKTREHDLDTCSKLTPYEKMVVLQGKVL